VLFRSAGTDGLVRLFDVRTGELMTHAQTSGWANDLDFRADRIAVGGRGKSVHVLDGAGQPLRSLVYGATIMRVSLSHDGKRCVASGTKGAALVWDVSTGQPLARLDAGDGVTSATFSRIAEGPTGYRVVASLGPEHTAPPALGTWHVP
jgi:WD40 repeat protein